MQEGLPRELWCRNLAHLMRVGLPICVLAKEVVEIASHLAFGMVERRHRAVATRDASRETRRMVFFLSQSIIGIGLNLERGPLLFWGCVWLVCTYMVWLM
jgi:hypothetical protein